MHSITKKIKSLVQDTVSEQIVKRMQIPREHNQVHTLPLSQMNSEHPHGTWVKGLRVAVNDI